jgi:Fe-S oxidoreductase
MLRRLAEQRTALELCTYCPKLCRFACPVATAECRETVTPWGLMTRAHHVLQGRAALDVPTARTWEHCTGCLRCQRNCKHDNDVATALYAARAEAVEAGLASPALGLWADEPRPADARFAALPEGGDVLLLPGHAPAAVVEASLALLEAARVRVGRPRRGVWSAGGRALAAGRPARFTAEAGRAVRGLEGARLVVCLDPDDAVTLTRDLPRYGLSVPAAIRHLSEVVADKVRVRAVLPGDVLYLDSCRLGRQLGVYEPPRRLLAAAIGGEVREAVMNRDQGGCCGAGAGFAATNPDAAVDVAREAAADVAAIPIVTAGPTCAEHLRRAVGPERAVHDWAVLVAQALADREEAR